jgi:Tfp pilus assembly protein PilF
VVVPEAVKGSETRDRPELVAQIVDSINAFDLERAARLLQRYESDFGATAVSLYYQTRVAVLTGDLKTATAVANRCVESFAETSICHEARAEAAMVRLVVEGNIFE